MTEGNFNFEICLYTFSYKIISKNITLLIKITINNSNKHMHTSNFNSSKSWLQVWLDCLKTNYSTVITKLWYLFFAYSLDFLLISFCFSSLCLLNHALRFSTSLFFSSWLKFLHLFFACSFIFFYSFLYTF